MLAPLPLAGSLAVAAMMGFVRSKLEDPATGRWTVPGTNWDAEGVLFALTTAVAFGGKYVGLGEWSRLASLGALGIGGHFMSEVGRQFGKTGQLSLQIGSQPAWDGLTFDASALDSAPAANAAQGLSSAA